MVSFVIVFAEIDSQINKIRIFNNGQFKYIWRYI